MRGSPPREGDRPARPHGLDHPRDQPVGLPRAVRREQAEDPDREPRTVELQRCLGHQLGRRMVDRRLGWRAFPQGPWAGPVDAPRGRQEEPSDARPPGVLCQPLGAPRVDLEDLSGGVRERRVGLRHVEDGIDPCRQPAAETGPGQVGLYRARSRRCRCRSPITDQADHLVLCCENRDGVAADEAGRPSDEDPHLGRRRTSLEPRRPTSATGETFAIR